MRSHLKKDSSGLDLPLETQIPSGAPRFTGSSHFIAGNLVTLKQLLFASIWYFRKGFTVNGSYTNLMRYHLSPFYHEKVEIQKG